MVNIPSSRILCFKFVLIPLLYAFHVFQVEELSTKAACVNPSNSSRTKLRDSTTKFHEENHVKSGLHGSCQMCGDHRFLSATAAMMWLILAFECWMSSGPHSMSIPNLQQKSESQNLQSKEFTGQHGQQYLRFRMEPFIPHNPHLSSLHL